MQMTVKMTTGHQTEPEVIVTDFKVNKKVKPIKMSLIVFLWIIYGLIINIISILQFPLRENNYVVVHSNNSFLQTPCNTRTPRSLHQFPGIFKLDKAIFDCL